MERAMTDIERYVAQIGAADAARGSTPNTEKVRFMRFEPMSWS
jgi:hypothetical protein